MSMKVEIGKRPVFCRGGGRRGARILGSFPSCTRALRTRVGTHSSQGLGCVRRWASESWKKNLGYRVFNFCRAIPLPCIVSEHRDRCRTPGRSGAARRPPVSPCLPIIRAHWLEALCDVRGRGARRPHHHRLGRALYGQGVAGRSVRAHHPRAPRGGPGGGGSSGWSIPISVQMTRK